MITPPDVGSIEPVIIRSVVVFPQPDEPTSTVTVPEGITREDRHRDRAVGEALGEALELDHPLDLRTRRTMFSGRDRTPNGSRAGDRGLLVVEE